MPLILQPDTFFQFERPPGVCDHCCWQVVSCPRQPTLLTPPSCLVSHLAPSRSLRSGREKRPDEPTSQLVLRDGPRHHHDSCDSDALCKLADHNSCLHLRSCLETLNQLDLQNHSPGRTVYNNLGATTIQFQFRHHRTKKMCRLEFQPADRQFIHDQPSKSLPGRPVEDPITRRDVKIPTCCACTGGSHLNFRISIWNGGDVYIHANLKHCSLHQQSVQG